MESRTGLRLLEESHHWFCGTLPESDFGPAELQAPEYLSGGEASNGKHRQDAEPWYRSHLEYPQHCHQRLLLGNITDVYQIQRSLERTHSGLETERI